MAGSGVRTTGVPLTQLFGAQWQLCSDRRARGQRRELAECTLTFMRLFNSLSGFGVLNPYRFNMLPEFIKGSKGDKWYDRT